MSRGETFCGFVCATLLAASQVHCSSASSATSTGDLPDASTSAATGSGSFTGSAGGNSPSGSPGLASGAVATGPGSASGTTAAASGIATSASGASASSGAGTIAPLTPAGTCPAGFEVCYGVCLEASLMGPNCQPALCPAPPAGTAIPSRTAGMSARGFTWNVTNDTTGTTVNFTPGSAQKGGGLSPTIGVDINYRVNGAANLQTATLTGAAGGTFSWTTQDVKAGDELDFYFHQTVGVETLITGPTTGAGQCCGGGAPPPTTPLIDTMWFHQTVGQAADLEPAYPITTTLAGRFRDRHPNEERYDHYVDTYFNGPVFSLTLVDHGNYLTATVVPVDTHVYGVDFKTYECFGAGMAGGLPSPTPLCFTPPELSAEGVRMNPAPGTNTATSSGTYSVQVGGQPSTVAPGQATLLIGNDLAYGQLLDFEMTFVRQPGPMDNRTYYTEMFMYYIGSGRFEPKVQHPWAHAAGDESITDVTVDQFGYAQHVPNITLPELTNFVAGKVLFEADFESLLGNNPPTEFDCPRGSAYGSMVPPLNATPPVSPIFTADTSFTNMALATITRPGYTSTGCFSCHHLDGKGQAAGDTTALFPDGVHAAGMGSTLLKLFSVSSGGTSAGPDPTYGTILDQLAPKGTTPEATATVTWTNVAGTFADGTPYTLRTPTLTTSSLRDGALAPTTYISRRIPRPVFGLGLLEAIPQESILANADPDDLNKDGISGRPNTVNDPESGSPVLGRFGWKAGTASIRQQAALAFVNDMGMTSPLYPKHACGPLQTACLNAVNDATTQLADTDLDHIESYMRGLSVPPRRNFQDPVSIQGQALFAGIGCIKCHVPNFVTSSTYAIPEMRDVNIQPFTDLLLHDMGPGLADDAPIEEGTATGAEWRTCPLWGNGTGPSVMYPTIDAFDPNGNPPAGGTYLHDGRARSITEAILWHGGEAQGAHDLFVNMPASDRAALLAYVAYPFADPVPLRLCAASAAPATSP